MSNRRNFLVIDIETSGLDFEENEIVQLSGKALNAANFDDHHGGEFNVFIKPQRPEKASKEALAVIGPVWDKALKDGIDAKVALTKFVEWVESCNDTKNVYGKPLLAGHNIIGFDCPFIEHSCHRLGVFKSKDQNNFPWSWKFDTLITSIAMFDVNPNVNSYSLDSMCNLLGIKRTSQYHDAMEDVKLEVELLRRSMLFFRKAQKRLMILPSTEVPAKQK